MNAPYIIAEVGVNFYDTAKAQGLPPLEAAKRYIKAAHEAGADAVKFQSYKADTLVSKKSPAYWDLTKEATKTQHELFSKHDAFDREDFVTLSAYCHEQGVDFLSTPFDFHSADYLADMMKMYKISSSDLTNLPFIRHIATKGKPILLSVGASYLSEIDEAIRAIYESGGEDICLMHCVLSYPCRYEDANLANIKTLKKIFPSLKIGYSDHTLPDESMTVITTAFLYGAEVIEKHFTLDKTLSGNDHYHAGDSADFRKIIDNIDLIKKIHGTENKTVLECERIPRREARRSLVLIRDMKKGDILTESDMMIKRPGTGIPPRFIDQVMGRPLRCDCTEDTILTWDMV